MSIDNGFPLAAQGAHPLKWSTNWDNIIPFQEDDEMSGKREKH